MTYLNGLAEQIRLLMIFRNKREGIGVDDDSNAY